MQSKSRRLTERQMAVISILKSVGGEWLTANQIGQLMYPDSPPTGNDVGSIGCTLTHLPQKCDSVEKKKNGLCSLYRWAGGNDVAAISSSERPMRRITRQDSAMNCNIVANNAASDSQLISEALLHYATIMVGSNPKNALRCAYLAGKGEFGPVTVINSQPVAKSKKPAIKAKPEPVGFTEIAVMPDDMDYDEFVKKVMSAYVRCEFTYPEAAKAAGISEDYFRRIVNGDAMPTRDTLRRAYYAIFSN